MVRPSGHLVADGYFFGSSDTTTPRFARSAARSGGNSRPADRHVAGVVIGAVADVLEDMRAGRERCLADPVRALASHLGEAEGRAVHPLDHVVAADARIGAA